MDSDVAYDAAGARALAHLDTLLAQAPQPDRALYSECIKCLVVLRDGLIAEWRASPAVQDAPKALEHVNAVISVVMAGHFPLGPVPWDELTRARGWLAEIVRAGGQT